MNGIQIYVDGSYNPDTGVYGSGIVAVHPDGGVYTYKKAGNNPDTAKLGNVAGEMIAAMSAASYAKQNKYEGVTICYDYLGIEYWPKKIWKAKKQLTSTYARYMREVGEEVSIAYQKINAHTGVLFNEIADRLAREAVSEFF